MIMTTTNNFGPFLAIHNFVDEDNLPPSAKRLWGALYGLLVSDGAAYICRSFFAKKLNLKKETISRALTKLEKAGHIKRTGEYKHNIFPIVTLTKTLVDRIPPAQQINSDPVIKRSLPSDHSVTDPCAFDHTKENKEEQRKEQNIAPSFSKEFSSNKKIAIKQKLKKIGLHQKQISKLVEKHSIEKIDAQIDHLNIAKREGEIKNPAAWLISAIERDFATASKSDSSKNQKEEEQASKKREAAVLAQQAKYALDKGDSLNAKEIALQSLAIADNEDAKIILAMADKIILQAKKVAAAKAQVPKEQQILIQEEVAEQKLKEMRRWYKSDQQILKSTLYQMSVQALFEERLLLAEGLQA